MSASRHISRLLILGTYAFVAFLLLALFPSRVAAQTNPVPLINLPLVPTAIAPGGPDFTLTVNGTGFVAGSIVNWNGSPLPTTFVTGSPLTATVPAANIATAGTAWVTVVNPAPGGGTSNVAYFSVTFPASSLRLTTTTFDAAPDARSTACADFNGDGKLDLAVAHHDPGGTVSILLGNGDGTFLTHVEYPTGGLSLSLTVGDFNRDGPLDLAVANQDSGTVSILLGNGDGTFQSHVDYASPSATFVTSADFDRDGKLDLAVLDYSSGLVFILLGNGDGTFQRYIMYPTGRLSSSLASGDFNGDGKLDLAVADDYDAKVSILLGNGDGTFQNYISYPTGSTSLSVTSGDFNGDGKLDLALTNSYSDTVSILIGNGDGTFQTHVDYAAGGHYPVSVASADLNGDSLLDLAVASGLLDGVSVLLGNGDGTFQNPRVFPAGTYHTSVTPADFNADGRLDLAAGMADGPVFVLLQYPVVEFSPSSLTFGSLPIGSSSAPQSVTLTNYTFSPLTISSIVVNGDFAVSHNCPISPLTLVVGGNCALDIIFSPTNVGVRNGDVTVTDDAPGSPRVISLTGTGLGPAADLNPTSLDFGNQRPGTTSPAQGVTITNTGAVPLSVTSIAVSGDFTQTNSCPVLPATLGVNASCIISVTFTPTSLGPRTGAVTITDDAPDSPQVVSLTGTGIAPTATLSPTSATFGNQYIGTTGLPQTVTLTNNGNIALTITSVTASPADFGVLNACTSNVDPGVSCSIGVFFDPTTTGTRTGSLTITDNAPDSPQTISLSGTGVDFAMASSTPSATASAGQSASYALTVSPVAGFTGTVSLTCTDPAFLSTCSVSPASVTLTGTGSASTTVTVTTTAPSAGAPSMPGGPPATGNKGLPLQVWVMMLAALLAVAAIYDRRRNAGLPDRTRAGSDPPLHLLLRLALGATVMTLLLWAACGGGAGGFRNPGTPPGTYQITVAGISTSGSASLQHQTTLTLTVN